MRLTPEERRGGCLTLGWGPPWNWLPSFQRGKHLFPGCWSITWLWWGLYWFPAGPLGLMVNGMVRRCDGCEQPATDKRKLDFVTTHDGTPAWLCWDCRGESENPER